MSTTAAGIRGGQFEVVLHRTRALFEEQDGVLLAELVHGQSFSARWEAERGDRIDVLATDFQGGAAGDEHTHVRIGREHQADDGRLIEQVLEVVEYDQGRVAIERLAIVRGSSDSLAADTPSARAITSSTRCSLPTAARGT